MTKTKYLIFAIMVSSITGCRSSKIVSRALPDNPTSYIFKVKIDQSNKLLKKWMHFYSTMKFGVNELYYVGDGYYDIWASRAKGSLRSENNIHDVWMTIEVDSSDIYFDKKGRPLEYTMECLAHFTPIDDSTAKLVILPLDAKVHIRDALLPSPPHFGNTSIYKKVKPTTIEEYRILQCFGKGLGVMNEMPELKL
jgi:hypothetical protein